MHTDIVQQELDIAYLMYQRKRDDEWTRQFALAEKNIHNVEILLEDLQKRLQDQEEEYMKTEVGDTENSVRKIQRWLKPAEFSRDFHRAQRRRERDTGAWLFSEPSFKKWKDAPSLPYGNISNVLVIKGQ